MQFSHTSREQSLLLPFVATQSRRMKIKGGTEMAEQVRLGIVGFGAQGSMYARMITDGMVPNMEIGAICDVQSGDGGGC